MRKHGWWLGIWCLGALTAAGVGPAGAQEAQLIRFSPAPQFTAERILRLTVPDVALNEMPTGLNATAEASLRWSVAPPDPGAEEQIPGETTLRAQILEATTTLAGQALPVTLPPPMRVRISPLALPLGLPVGEDSQGQPTAVAELSLAAMGVALLCALPPLPEAPVAPGDVWVREARMQVEGVGEISLQQEVTLAQVQEGVAHFVSSARAQAPDFSAPNPFLPGQMATVRGLAVELVNFSQRYDLARACVVEASGVMNLTARLVSPDLTAGVSVRGAQLSYAPPPPPAE